MTRRQVIVVVLPTVGVWLVLGVGLAAAGARPAVLVLAALAAAGAAAVAVAVDLGVGVRRLDWAGPPSPGRALVTDRSAMALRQQLVRAERYGATELQTALVELVDDRLATHHQIDRAADPGAASATLPPVLRALVDQNGAPLTTLRQLDAVVTAIEAL